MKKKLLLAVAVVAVLVGLSAVGVVASDRYKNYQNKKAQDAQVAAQQADDAKKAAAAEYTSLQTAYDKMRIECEKGVAAYGKLSPALAKSTPLPVCGPAVVR